MATTAHNEGSMLLLVPLPVQGHLPPMLQLATTLHSRGFSVTIVHPRFNSPDPSHFPHFRFLPVDDGLQPLQPSMDVGDAIILIKAVKDNCVGPFRECVEKLMHEREGSAGVRCIISDVTLYFTLSVASQLKLPRVGLRTGSVTSFLAFAEFLLNRRSPIAVIYSGSSN